jgi:PUA domain protein
MPTTRRRYTLKSKQAKIILNAAQQEVKGNKDPVFSSGPKVEIVEADVGEIYLVNGKPLLFKSESRIMPTLFYENFVAQAPKIVVDMGAVPHVCNGADVMAPGIVKIIGEFNKSELVVVIDERHKKPLALGESLCNAEKMRESRQGAVIKNLHYVSDKIWNFAKVLED